MSNNTIVSLQTLPVELVYRILDNLNDFNIFYSMRNVCLHLNKLIDTYDRYQVQVFVISSIFLSLLKDLDVFIT